MSRIFTVKMPDIGEGVVEGEVIEWLKKEGDALKQDEPVIIVMTDKATVELPSPSPGKLIKQYYKPGQMAIRDKPLYDIELAGESATVQSKEEASVTAPAAPLKIKTEAQPESVKEQPSQTVAEGGKALAAPPMRKLARDLGVDINKVAGSGKDGHITAEDIKSYLSKAPGPAASKAPGTQILHLPEDEEVPIVGIRNLMARKMKESNEEIPHFSYFEQVDATRLVQLRDKVKEEADKKGVHLTYMPLFIKALSLTIKQYPNVNSMLDPASNTLVVHKHHNVGIAIATQLGLIVPVLKDVEKMTLSEVIKAYDGLKQKALAGKLHPNDMKDSTITISNFGVLGGGGLWATPIINYPEVAILAVARIQKQPMVKNDEVAIRDVLNLSWSFDHRVIDGDLAASISHYFSTLIHNPAQLL